MVAAGLSILAMTLSTARSEAHCHIYRVWHYRAPQRCFTAMAALPHRTASIPKRTASVVPETSHDQIDIAIPPLNFDACPDGGDKLMGIAKLRALSNGP